MKEPKPHLRVGSYGCRKQNKTVLTYSLSRVLLSKRCRVLTSAQKKTMEKNEALGILELESVSSYIFVPVSKEVLARAKLRS